jgi:Leucine-rich repeat (LRR) protein
MVLIPKKILEDYESNNIDRQSAIKSFISLIENSDNDEIRVECLRNFEKIGIKGEEIFKFLENLLISDSSNDVRTVTAELIRNNFIDKALPVMKWAITYETNCECLYYVLSALKVINNEESRSVIIEEIKKIKKMKYLLPDSNISNKPFRKDLKKLFKTKKIEHISQSELVDIIMNFKIIAALKKKFYSVYYELEKGKVVKLDLSDIEYEVRGWKSEFKNNIKDLSEIPGLTRLKSLKSLYLSNNQISIIKDLVNLPELTQLYISNNKLSDSINLDYISKLSKLTYIDITGNELAKKVSCDDFKDSLHVKLSDLSNPYYA